MQKKRFKTPWSTYTLVSVGALAAINLILSRFLAINVGSFGRIQLGSIARIMAGLWFGPLAGGLCGLVSDLLGCLIQGYAVNPMITLAAVLWGVIPALFMPGGVMSEASSKRKTILLLCSGTVVSSLVCTLAVTTAALVWFNGLSFYAIFPTRLTQFFLQIPVYSLLVCLLYFSPVTGQVRKTLGMEIYGKRQKQH